MCLAPVGEVRGEAALEPAAESRRVDLLGERRVRDHLVVEPAVWWPLREAREQVSHECAELGVRLRNQVNDVRPGRNPGERELERPSLGEERSSFIRELAERIQERDVERNACGDLRRHQLAANGVEGPGIVDREDESRLHEPELTIGAWNRP